MTEYDNRNRFTLFKNNRKREGKKDADFNGTFTDEHGREYWINAWATTPKSGGDKFLSGSVTLKEDKPAPRPVQQKVEGRAVDLNDEVPFAPEFR